MKKMVLFLFLISFAVFDFSSMASTDRRFLQRQALLENERKIEKKYSKDYEAVEEKYSDRRDEDGNAISVKAFIRPEQTAELIVKMKLANLTAERRIQTIYSFVKMNFEFVADEENEDYWQYPNETLKRGKGDCEDLSILLASMLIQAGIQEGLIRVNAKNWHVYTTVNLDGKMVLETDPNRDNAYSYEWPSFKWNRQVVEVRKRR